MSVKPYVGTAVTPWRGPFTASGVVEAVASLRGPASVPDRRSRFGFQASRGPMVRQGLQRADCGSYQSRVDDASSCAYTQRRGGSWAHARPTHAPPRRCTRGSALRWALCLSCVGLGSGSARCCGELCGKTLACVPTQLARSTTRQLHVYRRRVCTRYGPFGMALDRVGRRPSACGLTRATATRKTLLCNVLAGAGVTVPRAPWGPVP